MHSRSLTWGLVLVLVLAFVVDAGARGRKKRSSKPKPTQGLRYASLTPDGSRVVFCYRGDIWVAPVDGKGPALRLTLHEAQDTLPRVSPDGKTIAFSSKRNGNYDIYLVTVEGGVPERITFHSGYEIVCDWSPDGTKILFVSPRDIGPWGADLFEVGVKGGTPRRITRDGGREGSYSPDGKQIVYIRGSSNIYWDDYEGSANHDIHVIDVAGGTPKPLTQTPGNERWPFFSRDGKTIWFVAEENGVANFYAMPAAGGERRPVTRYSGADVHRPHLSHGDRSTVIFERIGRLYRTRLEEPEEKPTSIPLVIRSDVRNSGIETRTITSGGEQVHISADGRQAAMVVRGDIWIMPASGGKARRVTEGPANDQWPRFSPDGKQLSYFNNARGKNDLYLLDLASGSSKPITTHPADDHFQNWSPDGRKIVFTSERSGNKDIWVVDLESGVKTQLTTDRAGDDDATYSPDGLGIAFDSGRGGLQAIYMMNADGSGQRRVTQDAGFYQVPGFSPDGSMLVYEGYSPSTGRSAGLFVTRPTGGPSVQISRDGSTAFWSTNGYVYFAASRGSQYGIFRVKGPSGVEVGEHVPFIGTVQVELRKELANLFDEAWTALRDGFYDPKMHGLDWNVVKKKYRDMAIDSENKAEFQNTIRQMLAELSSSHLGISGGSRAGNSVTPPQEENGLLGLEFDFEPTEDGGRRVSRVLAGGPADLAGLRVGDVVTRIGSRKLKKGSNLDRATAGTVGKETPISFRPRSANGLGRERSVTIEPLSLMAQYRLSQKTWVETCARRVKEATKSKKGEVGYIHLSGMNAQNLQKFQQSVARWNRDKRIRGMVLDVRNNGGGNIHGQLMGILMSKPLARVQRRGGPKVVQPTLYWDRPIVLLINQRSFSDAEVFPLMYKAAGIGPIVGVPTAGGVIGTTDITLSDGSRFRVPRVGFWTMDGVDLEGMGVEPDHRVDETAEDRLTGRDPQLAKAIEVIQAEITRRDADRKAAKKKPKPKPKPEPKPEPRPVPEPDPKPVPVPDPKPEPKPLPTVRPEPAPAAAEPADLTHPLADVRSGEWVLYRGISPDTGETMTVKVTVTDLAEGVASFANEVGEGSASGLDLPEALPRQPVLKLLPGFMTVRSVAFEDGEVRGKPSRLLVAIGVWADGSDVKLVFSDRIPAYGLLRAEMGEQVVLEATDWGRHAPDAPVVEKPAEEKPAEGKPAEPEPEGIPHPLHDAVVGEWVTVRQVAPNGTSLVLTSTVTEVTEDEVVMEMIATFQGREMPARERRRERKEFVEPREGFELVSTGRETLTINEQELLCITVTMKDGEGVEWKSYLSHEVPVDGLVRVERDGVVIVEIVEWGTGEDS